MISLNKSPQNPETRASQARKSDSDNGSRRASTRSTRSNGGQSARSASAVAAGDTPFTVSTSGAVNTTAAAKSNPSSAKSSTASDVTQGSIPGAIDLSKFTTFAIDRQASVAYSQAAEAKNYEIDFLYDQARSNWELNGRRGPEPVKPAYHEAEPEKIFNHLQSFRHGSITVPEDGSGYLSVDGYMTASPHEQRYGKQAEQLTAYSGSAYQQTKLPANPATPYNSDIFWGPATESLKKS